ncbi:unnamed protein product [Phaedon cochleariae]|uniref:Uncharacterized protein n=1 Tax=Phaedon cochleariae TaxID=80249 RepID=A0A9P0GUY0_PHACE|nr:unnamed protein product [Phaedon cochleariae]
MDLRYALVMLLKILISTSTLPVLYRASGVQGAALLGDPTMSRNSTNDTPDTYYDYEIADDSQELEQRNVPTKAKEASEEIPDPSPLVVSGYNLPENIFNRGKPFYVEKDPLTGQIDFAQKSPTLDDDLYDYVDEEPSRNIHDKSNIDRKDGGHRHTDVNQLTPNFHDFLNLPVKYNSAKYVYPLISNSYASTKIQGSVNKFHNHKDYNFKTSTKKPTPPASSPTYYSDSNQYFTQPRTTVTTTTTTTTAKPTTKSPTKVYFTTKPTNLLNTGMGHPSFQEEFEDYYDLPAATTTTVKTVPEKVYLTTENVDKIYLTSKAPETTSTKKTMSLFEQLFGEYDDTVAPPVTTKQPSLFSNLPGNKYNKNKYQKTEKPQYPSTTTTTTTTTETPQVHNSHAGPNVLTGTNMGLEPNYEYEDYGSEKYEDNVAVQSKPQLMVDEDLTIEPLPDSSTTTTTEKVVEVKQNITDYYDYPEEKENTATSTTTSTTTTAKTTTSTFPSVKVTSLPLGDNHLTTPSHEPFNRDPIIVATQNLREKLNSEKVLPKPFEKPSNPPSASNIHIAHNQDTVSFVVGNQQSVDGTQYVGTSIKENPYDINNSFRPQISYGNEDSVSYKIEAEPEVSFQLAAPPEAVGSAVTIQPLKNSEASLAIGVPVQVPGHVVDDHLNKAVQFPQSGSNKVVFPDEKQPEFPDLVPPPVQANREVLPLNSQPMYHQLPSDLTPPREPETVASPRPENRPARPPWDPRPGHFYSGKPEYNRPPRPPADVAYKRIDNLPNILPQFRPNMNKPPGSYYEKRFNRQPLLDRPSNRPIGFFEKMQPPPPPPPPIYRPAMRNNIPPMHHDSNGPPMAEDRITNEAPRRPNPEFSFYRTPPQPKIANRRNGNDDEEVVETLQMIQAKNSDKKDEPPASVTQVVNILAANEGFSVNTEKTIYKVYPVNTPPIKLDVIDTNEKDTVVIGTRAEPPLPPSKIHPQDFVFDPKERHDAPILKPHPRPSYATKTDFPYHLERPNSKSEDEPDHFFNNQWNGVGEQAESRIVTGHVPNQISATLKTYTEKPIAVAYTPTEPNLDADKYSMPNYGSPVIPEIQGHRVPLGGPEIAHRVDESSPFPSDLPAYPQLDFQAPFLASDHVDATLNKGWAVVRETKNRTTDQTEGTTMPYATTGEFDMEHFQPQLEGGFKPIYSFPEGDDKPAGVEVGEREER